MTANRPLVAVDVCLGSGTHAVEVVTADGATHFVLLVHSCEPVTMNGCACAQHAPHEQTGPLPASITARIGLLS